jgi:hypothetical protein
MFYVVEFRAVPRAEVREVKDGVVEPPRRSLVHETRIVTDSDPKLLETMRALLFPREKYEWREIRVRPIGAS